MTKQFTELTARAAPQLSMGGNIAFLSIKRKRKIDLYKVTEELLKIMNTHCLPLRRPGSVGWLFLANIQIILQRIKPTNQI